MSIVVCNIFFCILSLPTILFAENNDILDGIYWNFLKKRFRPNLKGFQY